MLVDLYKRQLSLLRELGCSVPKEYYCPFCGRVINDLDEISMEDAPQEALGGKKIALTCKECNNNYGRTIDCHLVNYITDREDSRFPVGMNRSFVFHDEKRGNDVRGTVEVGKNGEIRMVLPKRINDPRVLDATVRDLKIDDTIYAQMRVQLEKRIPGNIAAALIKNCYVILISYFGYTFLWDSFYDCFRAQMNNPGLEIIPEGLISKEGVLASLEDGVYVCDSIPLRGFFVVFTLKKRDEHKYAVFIPAIANGLEPAIEAARKISKGDQICIQKVANDIAFWDSKHRIGKLLEWSHSPEMKWADVVNS